jgi:Mg-chelatase subunit ChlD
MGSIVGGGEGGKAFTRLDLVKHVLNVLVASLESTDQLSLITFSDNTEVVLDLVGMTQENKILAKNHIRQMQQQSSTITGPAIKKAYELMARAPQNNLKSIILLTDGQDTQGKDMLLRIFDKLEKSSSIQFNTFGFSNDIWSDCLEQLALKGNGIFGFIPGK